MRANAPSSWGKGQVSLEFIVLLMAFMAFLSVWFSLLSSVREGISDSLEFTHLQSSAADIREAADASCLMGEGSSRSVRSGVKGTLRFEGKGFSLKSGDKSAFETLRCIAEGETEVLPGAELVLSNSGGGIKIGKGD